MSLITRSYRLRAYPNGTQRRLLDRWFGATRWLWNTALEIRSQAYRTCALSLTGNDLSRWLTQWKRTAGHEWLDEVLATALSQCLRDQDRAFRCFFARRARYPRFKAKSGRQSLRFQDIGAGWRSGYASRKHCSVCRFRLDELRLDQRQWTCPKCGSCHDRDINAARNPLTQGVRKLAGRDDRDLRADARDACREEHALVQVLAEKARSGHRNRAGLKPARLG